MCNIRRLCSHALGMVFVGWALVAAAAPARPGLISVELTLSGTALPPERLKLLLVDGEPGTLTHAPSGGQPGTRITLVARTGLLANAPAEAAMVPNPITLSLQVESATGAGPWVQLASPRFIIAGGSSARMTTADAASGPLEIEVSARAVSEAEAAAVRAGAVSVPPDPARR